MQRVANAGPPPVRASRAVRDAGVLLGCLDRLHLGLDAGEATLVSFRRPPLCLLRAD